MLVLSCAWKALPSHTNHFPLVNYPSTFCWGRLLQGVFALPDLNIQSLSHPPIPVSLSSVGYLCVCPSVHLPNCSLTSLRIRTSHLCAPAPLTLPDRSQVCNVCGKERMDNINPLHLYSSLIFQSISVSVQGWMLCPQIVFRNTTCILCILIYPPGKFEREEPFILPPFSGSESEVHDNGGAGEGAAAQGHMAGMLKTQETDSPPGFFILTALFLQHIGSTGLVPESALGNCPQRKGDCQSLKKILPPPFSSHAFRKEGRGNQGMQSRN